MGVSYDVFGGAFLQKITEYELLQLSGQNREMLVDGYLKRALTTFRKNCKYDLFTTADDNARSFSVDIPEEDLAELADIISEGMIVQWLKPYLNRQELLENILNTRDFTTYSPSELLYRVGEAYERARKNYIGMIREYSYNHGDLSDLHQ